MHNLLLMPRHFNRTPRKEMRELNITWDFVILRVKERLNPAAMPSYGGARQLSKDTNLQYKH